MVFALLKLNSMTRVLGSATKSYNDFHEYVVINAHNLYKIDLYQINQ